MSYDTNVFGEITVMPPVPAAIVAGSPFTNESVAKAGKEVILRPAADRAATLIVPAGVDGRTAGPEQLVGHANEILDLIGPGHTCTGELRCEGEYASDIWRVRVVGGRAVAEHAEVEIVFPADYTLPAGPAVTFDPAAARTWLGEPVADHGGARFVRGHDFAVDVNGRYDAVNGDRPADWLSRLLPAFGDGDAPHVWRTTEGVDIEVVETVDEEGIADGGAVFVVQVGRIRLASRWLAANDLAVYESDERGRGCRPQLDAVCEALASAAEVVNMVVDRHRAALAIATRMPATVPGVRFGHVNYHWPGSRVGDAAVGRWTFLLAPHVADFAAAWQAAVAAFRADPQMRALASRAGHGLNHGDLIDHGQHILVRHGLELVTEPAAAGSVTVDHDTPLVDADQR